MWIAVMIDADDESMKHPPPSYARVIPAPGRRFLVVLDARCPISWTLSSTELDRRGISSSLPSGRRPRFARTSGALFDLREVQLDGCGAAEDGDLHLELLLVGLDFFDRAREVRERSVD